MRNRQLLRGVGVVLALVLATATVVNLAAWRSTSQRLDRLEAADAASKRAAVRNDATTSTTSDVGATLNARVADLERQVNALGSTTWSAAAGTDLSTRLTNLERQVGKAPERATVSPDSVEAELLKLCNWAVANGLTQYVCGFQP